MGVPLKFAGPGCEPKLAQVDAANLSKHCQKCQGMPEGLSLASVVKSTVADNASFGSALDSATPGQNGVPLVATDNVAGILVDGASGEITISYTNVAGAGTLVMAPRDGSSAGAALVSGTVPTSSIVWNCNAASSTKAGTNGTLVAKYAPANCRT